MRMNGWRTLHPSPFTLHPFTTSPSNIPYWNKNILLRVVNL